MDNIAIVGMGCLFPSYADKEKFWDKLIRGERFVYQYDYQGTSVDRSGLIGPSADFFSSRMPADEIRDLDQYGDLFKWVAYVVDEALGQSKYAGDAERLKRTGMVFGCLAQPIKDQFDAMYSYIEPTVDKELGWILHDDRIDYHKDHRDMAIQSMFTDTEPARYIAQTRGFGGPAVMFSAACATPLYAMKLAAMYLNAGDADMIIAGSHCSNESDEAACGLFDTFGILCGTGQSRPLNKNSNGIVTGSGAGAFALKRLADAERDGDDILAVIENIGLSNDGGSGSGILSPSTSGQLVSYEEAYAGGLSHDIDYIECHATGTAAGDQSEVDSIEQFFNHDRTEKVLIGALKANTGHFLTATGCASIAKVVTALKEGVIPATIGVDDPIYPSIVRQNTPWEPHGDGSPRRAGINAFGFGGVNAHLVLREHIHDEQHQPIAVPVCRDEGLAIVGMGLNIGNYRGVEDLVSGLMTSTSAFEAPDWRRHRMYATDQAYLDSIGLGEVPKGSYINDFEFDTMRFKMPVNSDTFFLRRDMLLLETAAEALDEAGVGQGTASRTAVIINSALDFSDEIFCATSELATSIVASLKQTCPEMTPEQIDDVIRIFRQDEKSRETPDTAPGSITSIRGNRISSHWGFTGPSFTVFEQEVSIFRCVELAQYFIAQGLADQAVVGVVSFAGEIEDLYVQKQRGMMGLMREQGVAEGAVVLVVKPMEQALADGDRIYAGIDSVALSGVSPDGARNIETTLDKALGEAHVGAGEIRAVEIPRSYDRAYESLIEDSCRAVILPSPPVTLSSPPVILPSPPVTQPSSPVILPQAGSPSPLFETQSIEPHLGFGFALSAPASIIRQALQLYLSQSLGDEGTVWDCHQGKNVSLVTGYTNEKQFGCIVLSDTHSTPGGADRTLTSRLVPLPVRFSTPDDLRQKLTGLESQLATTTFRKINEALWGEFRATEPSNTAVLLCYSKDSLHEEVTGLLAAIPNFDDPGYAYTSPRGSYCTVILPSPPAILPSSPVILPSPPVILPSSPVIQPSSHVILPQAGSPPASVGESCGSGKEPDIRPDDGGVRMTRDVVERYQPKNYLLRQGAKLISQDRDFDVDRFLKRFDFYPLTRPSHVLTIVNGMPEMYGHLSDPENKIQIALKGTETAEQAQMPPADPMWEQGLAIVGMGLHVGAFDSVDSFLSGLMTSSKAFTVHDSYPTSSNVIEETLTMACRDSGLPQTELREAACVLLASDASEGQVRITADRNPQASRCGVDGPHYTLHGGDIVFFQGLALAHDLIGQGIASTVCLCTAPPADPDGDAAEGGVVLVLKDKDQALTDHNKIYAAVSSVTMEEQSQLSHYFTLARALETAGVGHGELRVVDMPDSDFRKEFDEEYRSQIGNYADERFATTDVEQWLGRDLGISTAVSFVKHALQLSFFDVFVFDPGTNGPSINDQLGQTSWGTPAGRRASLVAYVPEPNGGDAGFAVLSECIDTFAVNSPYPADLALMPLTCSTPDELRAKLVNLQQGLAHSASMRALWENAWRDHQSKDGAYTAVLAFTSRDSLTREIAELLAAIDGLDDGTGFVTGGRYESKLGSSFTADPYGEGAKIVYMNPPYTLHYFLLFYRLIQMFPQYRKDYLNYLDSTFQSTMNSLDYDFGFSGVEGGMIFIVQKIAREIFGLSPDILCGASLGEITSLVSYDSLDWGHAQPDAITTLFSAFRDVFTFSSQDMTPMYCKGSLTEIKRIAAEHGDVYVSLIASPDGAFIAGTHDAVDRVVKEGGFLAWRLANDLAIHTPLVEHFYDEVYDAARDSGLRLVSDKGYEIYSTYMKRPIDDTQEDFCEYAASILIKECDFYGLLKVLYDKGGRVFIDMGTGGSCYDWARDTLKDHDATIFPIYPPILDPLGQLFRVFSKLISNRVRLDCSAILASFSHPFMDEEQYGAGAPLVGEQAPDSLSAIVSQALTNNTHAYTTYADNEMVLLDWLGRTAAAGAEISKRVLWDRDQILEITGGSPSKVWGKRYEVLDSLKVRARMPMPPFLFVDRVIGIDAEFGQLRPSWIETETDIRDDCIMLTSENMITPTLLAESSHCAILLLSYMGIDVISGGGIGYRILNTRGVYHDDIPLRGDTVHSRLEFTDFIKSGSMTLVKSKFWCYKDDRLILTFDLLGGLFTEQDLAASNGDSHDHPMPEFTPLPEPYVKENLYGGSQGPLFYPLPTSERAESIFVNPKIQMVDRIVGFDLTGGEYGLGLVVAEKDIDESHWAFKVHFINDPVFPGTLLSEASSQIQFMYALAQGYMKPDKKYYLLNNRNIVLSSSFRGEVKPQKSVVRFVQQFREVTVSQDSVVIMSDLDVYWQGKHVSRTENCCLDIHEIIR